MAGWRQLVIVGAVASLSTGAAVLKAQQAAPAAQAPAGQGDQPGVRFRSSVDLVSVAAVVRDRKGRFVSDLSQRDFTVVEGGQPRPIVGFRAEADAPVRLAIVFDVSGSMRVGTKAADAREAARLLLSGLSGTDEAALFSFDTRLEKVKDFTSDFSSLMSSLSKVDSPYGQTSLYDAVAETAKAVVSTGGDPTRARRAAVVVLTDGVDTHSRLTPGEVSGIASGIDVPVYVMAVMSVIDDPHQFDAELASIGGLRDLARWTGGELYTMSAPAQTSTAAREIVSELRHQYLLAFEASPRPGWRSLEVKARGHDLTVRARSGYTAGGRASAMNVSGK